MSTSLSAFPNVYRHRLSVPQTVPVNVQGYVTVCDSQPEKTAGNLLNQPISEIWNNEIEEYARYFTSRGLQNMSKILECII